jgi:sarcosine oxidase subunit beta
MSETSFDVAVIGGGAVGTSTLFHLADEYDPRGVLFERGQLGEGSTGKAAGGVRNTYTTPVNIEIGNRAIEYFQNFADNVGEDLAFEQTGYMYLYHSREAETEWRERAQYLRAFDVTTEIHSPEEAARAFPSLDATEIRGAMYAPDCGHVDPHSLTQAFGRAAVDRGATIHTGTAVTDVVVEDGAVAAVETQAGTYEVDAVLNAAGPWAARVGAMAGVDVPIELLIRRIMVTSTIDQTTGPLVIDPERECYFKVESNGSLLVCDTGQDIHDVGDPDGATDGQVGYDYYLRTTEKVQRLVPALADLEVRNGWSGLQSHTDDGNAIVGPTDVDGFYLACGFSGHGVQQAPVVGGAMADLLIAGETDRFDVGKLSLDRFAGGDPVESEGMA